MELYATNIRSSYRNHFNFLISKLMGEELELVSGGDKFSPSFKLKSSEISHLEELADSLLEKVDGLKKTMKTEELIELLKQLEAYNKHQEKNNTLPTFFSTIFSNTSSFTICPIPYTTFSTIYPL